MYRRGDIYYIDFGTNMNSSKECGFRPALVVSNNVANKYSPVVTVIPLTAQVKKKLRQPTHVFLSRKAGYGLKRDSIALAEQLFTVEKSELVRKVGTVKDAATMRKVTRALQVQIGAI